MPLSWRKAALIMNTKTEIGRKNSWERTTHLSAVQAMIRCQSKFLISPFVGGAIWGIGALIRYITIHQEILVIIGIAACMAIPPFLKKKENKPETKSFPINDNGLFFERLLTKALFEIFTEYSRS